MKLVSSKAGFRRPGRRGFIGLALVMLLPAALRADEEAAVVAVSSRISPDYVRARTPDGAWVEEPFAFGEGGVWAGTNADASAQKLNFKGVAHAIAPALRAQGYVPATDPAKTKLLVMLYWGVTTGTGPGATASMAYQNLGASQAVQPASGPPVNPFTGEKDTPAGQGTAQKIDAGALAMVQLSNSLRDHGNMINAGLLGYDEALADAQGPALSALRFKWRELIDDLEENRYFVVLMAYDFQALTKEKKHKLVWETRFSIRERGNSFDQQLPAMAQFASRYFGESTHGRLQKRSVRERIRLDDLKILGVEPEK